MLLAIVPSLNNRFAFKFPAYIVAPPAKFAVMPGPVAREVVPEVAKVLKETLQAARDGFRVSTWATCK